MAQELFENFDKETQEQMEEWLKNYFFSIYEEHLLLISEIYDVVNLSHDVKIFARYNANKALMNLGFEPLFDYEEVNPVVLNGLNTESKTHDFFSMKGNGYQKMKSEALKDSDFYFEAMEVK